MKILILGGTGLISSACTALALQQGMEVTLLNRSESTRHPLPFGARLLRADVHADPAPIAALLRGERFDSVVDFIAYTPQDTERDVALFAGLTRQFVFISSASAYQKPPSHYLITEETPLANPYWQYSRDKIACEAHLMQAYHQQGFPVTIVRPSLTYGVSQIPLINGSWQHPWTLIDRMKRGKPVIVPGDGSSLWTLTWNEDFAQGLVGLLGQENALGQAFHITSDEVLTWNEIFEETGRALGVQPRLVHIPSDLIARYSERATGSLIGDKANSVVFDNSKIKRHVPGFQASVSWAQGVRRSLVWFQADPARQTLDAEANSLWDGILNAYARAYPQEQL